MPAAWKCWLILQIIFYLAILEEKKLSYGESVSFKQGKMTICVGSKLKKNKNLMHDIFSINFIIIIIIIVLSLLLLLLLLLLPLILLLSLLSLLFYIYINYLYMYLFISVYTKTTT